MIIVVDTQLAKIGSRKKRTKKTKIHEKNPSYDNRNALFATQNVNSIKFNFHRQ